MMNNLENWRTFLIKLPLKIKAIRDTYASDYKQDVVMAALLSQLRPLGSIKYQMLNRAFLRSGTN